MLRRTGGKKNYSRHIRTFMSDIIAQIEFSRHIRVCSSENEHFRNDTNDELWRHEWRRVVLFSVFVVGQIEYHATSGVRKSQTNLHKHNHGLPPGRRFERSGAEQMRAKFPAVFYSFTVDMLHSYSGSCCQLCDDDGDNNNNCHRRRQRRIDTARRGRAFLPCRRHRLAVLPDTPLTHTHVLRCTQALPADGPRRYLMAEPGELRSAKRCTAICAEPYVRDAFGLRDGGGSAFGKVA